MPVDGQEAPWSRASFVYATDAARVPEPPADLDALLAWAQDHPGRFTYPAPPDFTGSAFVRQVVQAKGEDAAFRYLTQLKPLMYRQGAVLPKSEAELNRLFADGKVDFAMSYDANFVLTAVRKGQFAEDGAAVRARRRHAHQRVLRDDPGRRRAPSGRAECWPMCC